MLVVPMTCDSGRRNGFLDPREVRWRERDLEGAKRLLELCAGPRADDRHDALALRQDPRDGELRGTDALLGCELLQRVDEALVLGAVLSVRATARRRL